MSKRLYKPRTLKLALRDSNSKEIYNVDPNSISNHTIHMMKDGRTRINLNVSVEGDRFIHILPLSPYEDGSSYKITIVKTIRNSDGWQIKKNYYITFSIAGDKIVISDEEDSNTVPHLDDKPAKKPAIKPQYENTEETAEFPSHDEELSDADYDEVEYEEEQPRKQGCLPWLLLILIIAGILIFVLTDLF
jgi:hypothetical protein